MYIRKAVLYGDYKMMDHFSQANIFKVVKPLNLFALA